MIKKDNGQFKPLGIAFAYDPINRSTVVCKIDPIITAFGLSVYKEDDEMDEWSGFILWIGDFLNDYLGYSEICF